MYRTPPSAIAFYNNMFHQTEGLGSFDLLTIITLVITIIALIVAISAVFYQICTLINSQLADKARECNSNLDQDSKVPDKNDKISAIVSGIITAKQLLELQIKNNNVVFRILLRRKEQEFVDQFYLQLHTSIRVQIKAKDEKSFHSFTEVRNKKIYDQIQDVKRILKKSIEKDNDKDFKY